MRTPIHFASTFNLRVTRSTTVKFVLAIAATVLGCGDPLTPPSPLNEPISKVAPNILDANHGGNPHFFFLPPMVTGLPRGSGTSDADQRPTVVVCEWKSDNGGSCGDIVAQFARRDGTSASDISYDGTSGAYQVNWNTDECSTGTSCSLDPTKTYRLRVLAGAYELGHADLDVVSTGKELKNVETGEYIGLVDGRTLPIKFRIEQGAAAISTSGAPVTVGTGGGVVMNARGTVALDFQPGSLSTDKAVTITDVTEPLLGTNDFSHPVELGPDGTTFDKPVTLTLAFDGSKVPPGVPFDKLAIEVWKGDSWEIVPNSVVNATDNTVSAPIAHFSIYQVSMGYFTRTSQPSSQEILVGESTTLYAITTAYDVAPATYCNTVRIQDASGAWVYETQCTTVSQGYSYSPVGMRVSYFATGPSDWPFSTYWVMRGQYVLPGGGFVYGYFPVDPFHPLFPPPSASAVFDAPGYGVVQNGLLGVQGIAPSPLLRGIAPGSALVYTYVGGQLNGPWYVGVLCPPPTSVTIAPTSAALSTIAPDNTAQFSATVRDANNNATSCNAVTWESADNSIASVDAKGFVTAHGSGTTTITAKTSVSAVKATATVTVKAPGYRIVYQGGDPTTLITQLIVQNSDGSNRHTLTSWTQAQGTIGSLAHWAPDGRTIAFDLAQPQWGAIYLINEDQASVDPTTLTRLMDNSSLNAGAEFSPDGKKILFLSTRSGHYELWIMDANGANQTRLLQSPSEDSPGGFSPDGSQIAFTRGTGNGRDVFVASFHDNLDGTYTVGTPRQVTAIGGNMSNVRWSPDGTRLVVSREDRLYIIDPTLDHASLSQLPPIDIAGMPYGQGDPDWSPDGKKIIFTSRNEWELYLVNPDGSGLEKIPTPTNLQKAFGSFDPIP